MTSRDWPARPCHVSVLRTEVLEWLDPQPGQTIVDATVGGGGHASLIASKLGTEGRLIGIDQDSAMLELARPRIAGCPTTLVESNFDRLRVVLDELQIGRIDGALADLGFASDQVEDAARGFSFQVEGPLDMRLSPTNVETAADIVNSWRERELADLFWSFGEERHSRRIARRIVEQRTKAPIHTTTELADLIRRCVPRARDRIDPATRVFQALRIAVNDELGCLERFLATLPDCLRPGGRIVIISFHSLEDRLVKRAFRQEDKWVALTRKPVVATDEEVRNNPRARSAKLRAAQYMGANPQVV